MDFAVTRDTHECEEPRQHGRLSMSLAHCTLTPGLYLIGSRGKLQQAYSNVGHGRCAFNVVIDIS